jgi:CheY-like chemotaxis protein
VRGDPDRLHSALLNLALNARDAMPEGGTLTIATRDAALDAARSASLSHFEVEPGRYVEICVHDTGAGLTEEARAHLFEPYFTTKDVGKGSGLGLPEVYGTVRAHRGAIFVESSPQRGTTFSLLLPASLDGAPAKPFENVDEPGAEPSSLRVLVIDDEANVRRSLGLLLRTVGHEVVEWERGSEAIEWFAAHRAEIDATIIDVMMPDMNGKELLARLRTVDPGLPVIVSSGYAADRDKLEPSVGPSAHFLPKPYTMNQLQRVLVAAACERAPASDRRSSGQM